MKQHHANISSVSETKDGKTDNGRDSWVDRGRQGSTECEIASYLCTYDRTETDHADFTPISNF